MRIKRPRVVMLLLRVFVDVRGMFILNFFRPNRLKYPTYPRTGIMQYAQNF